MRERQRGRAGLVGMPASCRQTGGAENNLGEEDNGAHTLIVTLECKAFAPPGVGLLQTITCAFRLSLPASSPAICAHTHTHTPPSLLFALPHYFLDIPGQPSKV